MRKRLYQALPENTEMIKNVISSYEDKKIKRLYAENSGATENGSVADTATGNDSYNGRAASAQTSLDRVSKLWDCYEHELAKLSRESYSGWYCSPSKTAKLCDHYVRFGTTAWGIGFSVCCITATLPMHLLLDSNASS